MGVIGGWDGIKGHLLLRDTPRQGGDRPGEQFAQFIDAECADHGFTHDDLRNWRPPEKQRGSAKRGGKAKRTQRAQAEEPA